MREASVVLVDCQLVFKRMARTRVASPFARERGRVRVAPSEIVLPGGARTPHLNPLPLAKGERRNKRHGTDNRRTLPKRPALKINA